MLDIFQVIKYAKDRYNKRYTYNRMFNPSGVSGKRGTKYEIERNEI